MIYIDEYNSPLFTCKPTINLVGFFFYIEIKNYICKSIMNRSNFEY